MTSKNSKNSKNNKEKKELDLILAQLKKSYSDDESTVNENEDALNSEINSEFSELLGKFFVNESPSADSTINIGIAEDEVVIDAIIEDENIEGEIIEDEIVEDEIVEDEIIEDEIVEDEIIEDEIVEDEIIEDEIIEDEIVEDEIIEEDTSKIGDVFFDRSTTENQSEDDVDNVLNIMFSHASATPDLNGYLSEDNIDNEGQFETDTSCAIGTSITEEMPSEIEDGIIDTSDTSSEEEYIVSDYDDFDNSDEDLLITDIELQKSDETPFAVEDEEYYTDEESPIFDDTPVYEEISAPQPRIISDPKLYTFDPLQDTLPELSSVQDEMLLPDILSPTASSSALEASNEIHSDKIENLDETDISLLLKFGYNKEVKEKVGEEKAQKAIHENVSTFHPESHKIPYGFCGMEFSDKNQIKQIKNKYRSDKSLLIIQIAIIALLAVAMLAVEIFFEFISDRTSYLVVNAVELSLIAISALVLNKKLISGILGIVRFEANLYSILAYLIFAYVTCDIATGLIYIVQYPDVDSSGFMVFGLSIMLYILLVLISELINCLRESAGFDLLCRSNRFLTVEKHFDNRSARFGGSLKTNRDMYSFRITQTSFITDYFKKISKNVFGNVNLIYVIGIVPISSLIVGSISALISKNIMQGIFSMMSTTFLAIPYAFVVLSPITEYIYSTLLRKRRIALVGSDTAEKLSKTDLLFFDDTNAVEIISYTEIHPTKNSDRENFLDIAQKVFCSLDGPIGEFIKTRAADATSEQSVKSEVIINSISDNGIDIYFDSHTNIILGDKNYLQTKGIKVRTDSNLNTTIKGFDRSIVYMAFDGVPRLGFIITSKIRPEFSKIAAMLDENAIKVYVDTYEPELNDLYFEQNNPAGSLSVSVCKSEEYESTDYKPVCDGSIICASDSTTLAKAILDCRKIVAQRKKNSRTLLALITSGLICSVIFTVLLSISRDVAVLNALRSHSSLIFIAIMLLHMIPCIASILKIIKSQDSNINNSKETK